MQLPNGDKAIIDEDKLIEYALSPTHRIGRHHAELFRRLLGIQQKDWQKLHEALRRAAVEQETTPGRSSEFGTKDEIRFPMTGPRWRAYHLQHLDDSHGRTGASSRDRVCPVRVSCTMN
jgi:hypothetical protein